MQRNHSNHAPPPTSRLMPNHFLSNVYLGKFSLQVLLLSMMLYGVEYIFGQASCLCYVPS